MQDATALSLVELLLAAGAGICIEMVIHWALRRFLHRRSAVHALLRRTGRAAQAAFALSVALIISPALHFSQGVSAVLHELATLSALTVVAWVLIVLVYVAEEIVQTRFDVTVPDNLAARKILTRTGVIRRVIVAMILVLTGSSALMTFPAVRALGASLLASAGLVGLIAGLAAQPVLSNLIAGLQIALTQPIRIDDVVVINGDWGWIEEIDTTFVVVRIWDLRRLIVPLTYFLQNPIENWTYHSASIIGYVYVYADYRVSVDAVREELQRILAASPDWDTKSWNLQVTGLDEQAMQMRALFSAADSGHRWNLMVEVQEKLIAFLQTQYPEHLPRTRVEIRPEPPVRRPGS
ncbi:MAG: mechanosensitive ion channel [Thermaerobacter sp.]|nr:mechanosensitive ion channel [Thermaerobacter sp.]